ncbi:MAG: alpha/beta hydrolase [Proteobacteria bacterium]|nr:alpha/beta hydrolase [Pseudomonadota bacterium]
MSSAELAQLITLLRSNDLDLAATPAKARSDFSTSIGAAPVAADISFEPLTLAGRPALASVTPGARADKTLLYIHGGAFVIGSPSDYRSLTGELGRAAGVRTVSLDYRLAPEHPFPAAVDDCVAAYRALLEAGNKPADIALAGDSAGGGLVISTLVAARDAGLPMPAAALVISPWVDLACTGGTMQSKQAEDPSITREGLQAMAALYLQGKPLSTPLASPLYADLRGLPPLFVQVGSAELLLDDAVRLAGAAGAAGVPVHLSIWPNMPHVWHIFGFMLSEGRDALTEAGVFLGTFLKQ